jgi:predicted Zn-dependent protease
MADSTTLLTAIANSQASFESLIQNNQQKTDASLKEIMEGLRAWRKETNAYREATEVCLEKTEGSLESMESNSLEMESESEY